MSEVVQKGLIMIDQEFKGKEGAIQSFARNVREFQWGEGEDSKVRLVFMIGVPNESSQLHLKFISQLSKKLLDEEFREKLLTLDSIETILYQLKTIKL